MLQMCLPGSEVFWFRLIPHFNLSQLCIAFQFRNTFGSPDFPWTSPAQSSHCSVSFPIRDINIWHINSLPTDWQTEALLHWPRSPCNGNCSSVPWHWPQGNQQPLPNEVSIFLPLQTIFCCSCLKWKQAVTTTNSSTALFHAQWRQPSFTSYLAFQLAAVFELMLWPVGKICGAFC